MEKVYHTYQKFNIINTFKWTWREFAPFKISLAVLYSVVWIWGLAGNILKHLSLLLFLFVFDQLNEMLKDS